MNFSRLVTAVSCVMALGQAAAQESRLEKTFSEWDKNKDGKLTKVELPGQNQRNFERVDADKDGFISLKEHVAFLTRSPIQNKKDWSGFKIIKDIAYAGTDHERQTLDLALPLKRKSDKQLPVIAYIHGGAWRAGSKNGGLNRLHDFIKTGEFAGVTIGYRLSQHARWPAQIHDCKAAIRWLKGNAKKYGIDANRLAVWGNSAGGHLVAMIGVSGDIESLEGKLGKHLGEDSRVNCVVDFCGPTHLLSMGRFPSKIDHDAPSSPESQLIGGAIQENKKSANNASPITYVTMDDAPILIVHGTDDPLVPFNQAVIFHSALRKAGVKSEFLGMEGMGHGLGGPEVDNRVRKFLESQLLRKK